MKRRIKTLGVVLASVFAMSAVVASAASAAEFHSAVHPQTVTGTQTTGHVFTTNAGTVTCKKVTFSGTTNAKTSTTQTLAPEFKECTAFGFINIVIHVHGCTVIFHRDGVIEIICPPGGKVEITVPFCTVTIGGQFIAGGQTFANNGGKTDIVATTNVKEEIDYNECGTARTNGSYKGTTTVTGASGSVWYE
jgi:hypothetical protein